MTDKLRGTFYPLGQLLTRNLLKQSGRTFLGFGLTDGWINGLHAHELRSLPRLSSWAITRPPDVYWHIGHIESMPIRY